VEEDQFRLRIQLLRYFVEAVLFDEFGDLNYWLFRPQRTECDKKEHADRSPSEQSLEVSDVHFSSPNVKEKPLPPASAENGWLSRSLGRVPGIGFFVLFDVPFSYFGSQHFDSWAGH
jgi:hypothetical protein